MSLNDSILVGTKILYNMLRNLKVLELLNEIRFQHISPPEICHIKGHITTIHTDCGYECFGDSRLFESQSNLCCDTPISLPHRMPRRLGFPFPFIFQVQSFCFTLNRGVSFDYVNLEKSNPF